MVAIAWMLELSVFAGGRLGDFTTMAAPTKERDLLGCHLVEGVHYPSFITADAVKTLQNSFECRESDIFLLTRE
jgi:hypothetical protein